MIVKKAIVLAALIAFFGGGAFTSESLAALSVVNGNFQADVIPAQGYLADPPTGWFASTADTFADFLLDGDFNIASVPAGGELPIAGGDAALVFDTSGGYVYQTLGTLTAGTTFVQVEFDAMERKVFANGGVVNRLAANYQLQLFAGPFATAANGVDIAASLTPVATVVIEPTSLFATVNTNGATDPELVPDVRALLNVSTLAAGTQLWLRMSSPSAVGGLEPAPSAHLDNVSVAELQYVLGDADGNGLVNNADFNIINSNMFKNVASRILGDLNGDHFVDFADYRQWKDAPKSAFVTSNHVPEPAGVLLVGVAALAAAGARRRLRVRR